MRITQKFLFMNYPLGLTGVVGDTVCVADGGISVVGIGVDVGGGSVLGTSVVGTGCEVFDAVGEGGTIVIPGVRVGMFGTQRRCPTKIVMEEPIQLARCN